MAAAMRRATALPGPFPTIAPMISGATARTIIPIILLPLLLTACSSPGTYPSLARRDAERIAAEAAMPIDERVSGSGQPAAAGDAATPLPPLSGDMQTRIAQLVDQAREAHGKFESSRSAAQRTISAARGARPDSTSWISAHVALAGLEAARGNAMIALAELDRLYIDERDANPGIVTPLADALGQARERVESWVGEEDRVIARLMGQLGG